MEKEIEKELRRVVRELKKKKLYPLWHPDINGSWIEVKCVSPYFDGMRRYFANHPEKEEDWELMEKYVILDHALVCPRFPECPTAGKVFEILKE